MNTNNRNPRGTGGGMSQGSGSGMAEDAAAVAEDAWEG